MYVGWSSRLPQPHYTRSLGAAHRTPAQRPTHGLALGTRLTTVLFLLATCFHIGLAIELPGRNVLDLLRSLNASMAGTRLHYTTGPNASSQALLLDDSERDLVLPASVTDRALELLAQHREISFLFSVKQDVGDSGTLIAFSSPNSRFLEIESSGRRNELRFHYSHDQHVRVETFPYRLADGLWHKLAVTLSGDHVSVYVNCSRIYQRVIFPPDRTSPGSGSPLSLYVGQRNGQHALFRGALQDVRIVTQAHGFLLQCPDSDTECPTCAKFQDLEQRVLEMSTMYKDISLQLVKAEERLANLEQCECLHYCYDNGTQRREGEEWKKDKCNMCRCKNGTVECHQEECPATECSNPVYRDGECCPICVINCYYSGKYYNHGEGMSPRVCVTCTCNNGRMVCERQDTEETCPKLDCPKSERFEVHGQCCPVCKNTDFCSLGHTCHSNASCYNLATKYACQCNPGFQGDGTQCQDIDECQQSGGRHGHHCSVNTECVNTPGSYRCDCIKGHNRLDSYECKDYDECVHGTHKCHPDAHCVNVNGSYSCTCADGYAGDGFDCQPHCVGCRNGGRCIAPNVCECRHGYIGPNCEHDIDECALGISKCHGNSVCVNMPGRYHCDCLEGYHSSWPENHHGSLCFDMDECRDEGEGHTCHPSMQCVNTDGAYSCECKSPNSCNSGCIFEGSEHPNGSVWRSPVDKCKECHCQTGRTVCHQARCDCNDPAVDLDCCPRCDLSSTCQHQEYKTHQQNGDTWVYQCMLCECLHGETDCWPLVCPQLTCQNAIQRPGDCCPVCADSDPCTALTLETGGQDLSQTSCLYMGTEYSHGDQWRLETDPCASCQCKAGHICCTFSQTCTTPYSLK